MSASGKADFRYAFHSALSYVTGKTKIGLKRFKGNDDKVKLSIPYLLFSSHGQPKVPRVQKTWHVSLNPVKPTR